MKLTMKSAVIGLGLLLVGALPALADGDSSSDLNGGFVRQVESAQGVVLKVPVDRAGNELTEAAQLRLVGDANTSADLAAAFDAGSDARVGAVLSPADIARDSSTSGRGWNGWNSWNNQGWQSNYYSNYQPTYYNYGNNYGNSYRYGYQSSRDDWGRNGGGYNDNDYGRNYGYRYYYYGRCN